jgi:hypothetical protein
MPTCTHCQQEFPTRNARDQHSKQCKSVVTVEYPNGTFSLEPSQDGKFTCYCAYSKCPKAFATLNGLRKHVKHVALPWNGPTHAVSESEPSGSFVRLEEELVLVSQLISEKEHGTDLVSLDEYKRTYSC